MSASVRSLASQTVVYGLSSIVPRFLNFLLVPLYTYVFKPAEYGVVADLYSWAVLLNILVTYGMETAVFRYTGPKSGGLTAYSTAFYSVVFTSLIFLLLVLLNVSKLALLLGYPNFPHYVIFFALIIALDAVSAILFVKLRIDDRALKFSAIKISNVLLNVVLNLLFLLVFPAFFKSFGIAYTVSVEYIFVANLVASFLNFALLASYVPSPQNFNFSLLRTMLKYGIPLMLSGIVGAVNDVIDRQFIKYFSPKGIDPLSALGVYFANLKLAVILVLFVQAFRYAAEPFFFRNAEEKGGVEAFARVAVFYLVVSMSVFLFTYANLPVFKYFIGADYWSGLFIVPVVLLANVFAGLYLNFSMWYKLVDKTYVGLLIILGGCLFTIILDLFFVPLYGYPAAAVIRLLSYVLMTALCYILGQRFYPVPYKLAVMLKYFSVAILLFVIQYVVTKNFDTVVVLVLNNFLLLIFVLYFLFTERLINTLKEMLWSIKLRLKL